MAKVYYGPESHVMFGYELVAYGTKAAALDIDLGKIVSVVVNENDNPIRQVGVGLGRDETDTILGAFDVTGTITWQPRHARAFIPVWGDVKTTGASDPYTHAIQKADGAGDLGIASDLLPSISLEIAEKTGTDRNQTIVGVVFRNIRISGAIGQPIQCVADFVGQKPDIDSTPGTYVESTEDVYVVSQAGATWDAVTMGLESFTFTLENNLQLYRVYGSRFIVEPVPGMRQHNFSATLAASDAAIFASLDADFYGQAIGSGPVDGTGATKATKALVLSITKVTVDREIVLSLPTSTIDDRSLPIEGANRVIMTINGHSLTSTCTSYDGLDSAGFI